MRFGPSLPSHGSPDPQGCPPHAKCAGEILPGWWRREHKTVPSCLGKSTAASDALIAQAYRQIFFHAFKADRDPALESQLHSGQITVRDFVCGLLLSQKFRDDFYPCNSNYRMVDQIVGRVLGRSVHGDQERIALSILIAEKGLPGLVDHLLNPREYLEAFGIDQVPHQRSRVLPGQAQGVRPFNQRAPRYEAYWREASSRRAPAGPRNRLDPDGRLLAAPSAVAGGCALPSGAAPLAGGGDCRRIRAHSLPPLCRLGDAQHRPGGMNAGT